MSSRLSHVHVFQETCVKDLLIDLILFISTPFVNMTVAVGNRATMVRRTVTAISVEDVEKRREPSKHYVSSVISFILKGLGFLE